MVDVTANKQQAKNLCLPCRRVSLLRNELVVVREKD